MRLSAKAQLLRILRRAFFSSTNHAFDRQQKTIIRSPNSLLNCEGGRALNQLGGRLSPTTGVPGLPCMRADGTGCAASRSFQYSRTANFRAMATFATALRPALVHSFFLRQRPCVIASACSWFFTEVRKRTSLCRCLSICRRSSSAGRGYPDPGKTVGQQQVKNMQGKKKSAPATKATNVVKMKRGSPTVNIPTVPTRRKETVHLDRGIGKKNKRTTNAIPCEQSSP